MERAGPRKVAPLLLVLSLLLGSACERAGWKTREADLSTIELSGENMTIHTGSVGMGEHESRASYVLVDATNKADRDLGVTLGGTLLDEAGAPLGDLDRQSLRIPAKGTVTFALVAKDQKSYAGATGATIEVTSAIEYSYEQQVQVSEVHEYPDGDRVIIKAFITNTVERPGKVLTIATFYDRNGKPMKRPSTIYKLAAKARRGVQFVGPSGSVKARIFVGDIVY